jgi:hypothetical protein
VELRGGDFAAHEIASLWLFLPARGSAMEAKPIQIASGFDT